MTRLVSHEQLVSLLRDNLPPSVFSDLEDDVLSQLEDFKPQVVCYVDGGKLETAHANCQIDMIALDGDLDCVDEDSVGIAIGDERYFREAVDVTIDPAHYPMIAEADEIDLWDED